MHSVFFSRSYNIDSSLSKNESKVARFYAESMILALSSRYDNETLFNFCVLNLSKQRKGNFVSDDSK